MKAFQRNGTTYFPAGATFVQVLNSNELFQHPLYPSEILEVVRVNFRTARVSAINIETQDRRVLSFNQPVYKLKKF